MGLGYRNLADSRAEFVKTYKDIRGVDFSASSPNGEKCRVPYAENLYRDYSSGDYTLESIPGYRKLFDFGEKINGIFCQRVSEAEEYIIVHAGTKLYRFSLADRDSGTVLTPISTLLDTKSSGFPFEESFYILDGENITVISKDGKAGIVSDETNFAPFIPTRYKNGIEYEQANLLSDKFKEEMTLDDYKDLTYASDGLIYAPNSDGSGFSVIGADAGISGVVHIPSRINVAGKYKDITKIQDLAFKGRHEINAVITNEGLEKIGAGAFQGCRNLSYCVVSDSVESIGDFAFEGCETLTEIYIGAMCREIGGDVFKGCTGLNTVHYAGAESEYEKIMGSQSITSENILYGSRYRKVDLRIPVFCPASQVESVSIGDENVQFFPIFNDGFAFCVDISIQNRDSLLGKTVLINCKAAIPKINTAEGSDIRVGRTAELFSNGAAIKKCKKTALFDGRVFLCGNPDMPNTVFFSSDKNPLYFGSLDYFQDGGAGYSVKSLLPAQDNLIVFKSADDGGGSIFYHNRENINSKIRTVSYPVKFTNNAIPALGDSTVFYDDALFISELGICGLEKNSLGGVNPVCRSHNVNQRLLSEGFEDLRFTSWQGYLVVCAGERMYLADSRSTFRHSTGEKEYEWFFLSGIGAPKSEKITYRFESFRFGTFYIYEGHEGEIANDYSIYSIPTYGNLPPERMYGALVDGRPYHIYRSDELLNEGVYKCTEVLGVGELLFFGCENGSLMLFNNDKRGEIPERLLLNNPELNVNEYKKTWGQRIHPDFYTFAGIAPRYVLKTGMDSCDIPYLEKNTTPASVTIKYKSFVGSNMRCECTTDREKHPKDKGFGTGAFSFDTICFDRISFDGSEAPTSICCSAPTRWVEKELTLISDEYRSPIGICSLSYRFKIKGRIKNR